MFWFRLLSFQHPRSPATREKFFKISYDIFFKNFFFPSNAESLIWSNFVTFKAFCCRLVAQTSKIRENHNFFPFWERNFLKNFSDFFWCVLSVCGVFSILGPRPLEKIFLKFHRKFFSKKYFSHQIQNYQFGRYQFWDFQYFIDNIVKTRI